MLFHLTCTQAEEYQNFANWFQYHRTRMHVAIAAVGNAFATALGEVDLQLDYELMKDVKLTVGYSTMFASKWMPAVAGPESYKRWQDWAFVSLNINPRILSFKW